MLKSFRLNLLLFLFTVLFGLLVWFSQPSAPTLLTPIDPATISRIEISDLSGRHILLQKHNGIWRRENGIARQARIEQLLGICGTISLDNFPAPADLSIYALDPAPIRLQLNDEILDFGATDPIHGWRYVHYRDRVHLIADGFYHHLSATQDVWREAH